MTKWMTAALAILASTCLQAKLISYESREMPLYDISERVDVDETVQFGFTIDTTPVAEGTYALPHFWIESELYPTGRAESSTQSLMLETTSNYSGSGVSALFNFNCEGMSSGDLAINCYLFGDMWDAPTDWVDMNPAHHLDRLLSTYIYPISSTPPGYTSLGFELRKVSKVPEPATLGLLAGSLALLGLRRRII